MLTPCRNKIVFTGIPDEFTINLCNEKLKNYLRSNKFIERKTYSFDLSEITIDGIKIYKEENTFHQNDDNIQKELYKILLPILKMQHKNVLFIGGECYVFSSIVNAKNIYCYSDSQSIINSCHKNIENAVSKLVDYNNFHIPNIKYDLCILNVGIKGLGKFLSNYISELQIKEKYYISCNGKSFIKDGFTPINTFHIRNNLYGITLYQI